MTACLPTCSLLWFSPFSSISAVFSTSSLVGLFTSRGATPPGSGLRGPFQRFYRQAMSISQPWPLSQDANKSNGVCSVCFATRQLHIRDGTVHKHGPRNNPCPGSNKAPLSAGIPVGRASNASCHTVTSTANPQFVATPDPLASTQSSNTQPTTLWLPTHPPIIKHIPKSARPACASHLSHLLSGVVSNPGDVHRWLSILNWTKLVLATPKRGGKRHNVTSVVKKTAFLFA